MPNKEMVRGEGQRKEVYYVTDMVWEDLGVGLREREREREKEAGKEGGREK
jgi:hypothetical protein